MDDRDVGDHIARGRVKIAAAGGCAYQLGATIGGVGDASKDAADSAAADPRRVAALQHVRLRPEQQHREHHDVERYVLFG